MQPSIAVRRPGLRSCSLAPESRAATELSPAGIRSTGLRQDYQPCYTVVATAGKSHADKRRAWWRALPDEKIRGFLRPGVTEAEIQAAAERSLAPGT